MSNSINISPRSKTGRSYDYKIISVRMKEDLLERIDSISAQTNRSRNEIINLLLEASVEMVTVE